MDIHVQITMNLEYKFISYVFNLLKTIYRIKQKIPIHYLKNLVSGYPCSISQDIHIDNLTYPMLCF